VQTPLPLHSRPSRMAGHLFLQSSGQCRSSGHSSTQRAQKCAAVSSLKLQGETSLDHLSGTPRRRRTLLFGLRPKRTARAPSSLSGKCRCSWRPRRLLNICRGLSHSRTRPVENCTGHCTARQCTCATALTRPRQNERRGPKRGFAREPERGSEVQPGTVRRTRARPGSRGPSGAGRRVARAGQRPLEFGGVDHGARCAAVFACQVPVARRA
jgi:hypothetical protein